MPKGLSSQYDVVVLGGTPGGIASAIAAARLGHSVALVEYHRHFGGMSASGLGKSDIENRGMIEGIFGEFIERILAHYIQLYGEDSPNVASCDGGYWYEPSVAEHVFMRMLAECVGISLFPNQALESVFVEDRAIVGMTVINRTSNAKRLFRGKIFIDATYEGDLFAAAGADYRYGREPRDAFQEAHAGVIYYDYEGRQFLHGTTHEGDDRLPAYTYRMCLTDNSANGYPVTKPTHYERDVYLAYLDDLKQGRLSGPKQFKPGRGYYPDHFDTMLRALSVAPIPNRKYDCNINPRPLAFPFPEENEGYVEGDWATRERISQRHRDLALGLLYFLQNDPAVPAEHRNMAKAYQLPLDEFTDNDHFPFQLYIREARRLVGLYTMTENDITGRAHKRHSHHDSIAVGEFPIDSFPVRKRQPGDDKVLEGYLCMLDDITCPYEIPYRVMIPERLDGMIVPVAVSTTHVAYSSVRMEPTWMALGQAAGTAAHLAIAHGVSPRRIPIDELQTLLTEQGQVLDCDLAEMRGSE